MTKTKTTEPRYRHWLLPALFAAACLLGLAAAADKALSRFDDAHQKSFRDNMQTAITALLASRLKQLEHTAARLADELDESPAVSQTLAAHYLDQENGVVALGLISDQGQWAWQVGEAAVESGPGEPINRFWQMATEKAREADRPTATPLTQQGSERLLHLLVPMAQGQTLSVTADPKAWLAGDEWQPLTRRLHLALYDADQHSKMPVLESEPHGLYSEAAARSNLEFAGRDWLLLVSPLPNTMLERHVSWLRQYLWLAMILVAAVFAGLIAVMGAQLARSAQREQELNREVANRQQQIANRMVELTTFRKALRESDHRAADLILLSGAVILEIDDTRRIGYVSNAFVGLLGHSTAWCVNRPLDEIICAGDHLRFVQTLAAARTDRELQQMDLDLLDSKERVIACSMRVIALFDPVLGCIGYRLALARRAASV